MPDITHSKILIMATDGFEQSELLVPRDRLAQCGATVHVATLDGDAIKGWDKSDWGETVEADHKIADVDAAEYDALVLPGGQINPDILRTDSKAVETIGAFAASHKVIGAICHAPWLLIEAGLVKGLSATSYHSIRTDMENAGADWQDAEVVVDNGIVTSRSPDDLDAFVAKIIEEVEEGSHRRAAAG